MPEFVYALLGVAAVSFAVFGLILKTCLHVVGPHEALVLSGRVRRRPDGSMVAYRVVLGGRIFRTPILEVADRLDLRPFEVSLSGSGSATVRISREPGVIDRAIERFLGRPQDEIREVARTFLEERLRQARHAKRVVKREELAEEIRLLGLELDAIRGAGLP